MQNSLTSASATAAAKRRSIIPNQQSNKMMRPIFSSSMILTVQILIILSSSCQQVSSYYNHPTYQTASSPSALSLISQQQQQQQTVAQTISPSSLQQQQQQQQQALEPAGAPVIHPFALNEPVQEYQRLSLSCSISFGDSPITISWLKDGQPLTQQFAQAKKIVIQKPDLDTSSLKFNAVKLEHSGNYTCVAKNLIGQTSYTAQLIVRAEPRWLREPLNEPIIATRGQTIVIDCLTIGFPKPQHVWKLKNQRSIDFEHLAATGKMSLAANGSLVIRNAEKADEANYLCTSTNGIGRGLSWSTSLKVNVPAHFKSNKLTTSVVRKKEQIQLRCDAYGDLPIQIEWYKNGSQLVTSFEPRYSIFNTPIHTSDGIISTLNIKQTQRRDNSIYECVARNSAGDDRLPIELMIQEEPDTIQDLQTTQVNSRSVNIVWTEPYDGKSRILEYRFLYRKIDSLDDTILSLPVVAGGEGLITGSGGGGNVLSIKIERLEPLSKYILRAQAVNSIGRGEFGPSLEFNTDDEAPEFGPNNLRATAINSTSILVNWDEIPRSKQSGRIHGYYIGYRVANTTSQFIYKPFLINNQPDAAASSSSSSSSSSLSPSLSPIFDALHHHQHQHVQISSSSSYNMNHNYQQLTRLETSINDLRRDTQYEITVVAFNSRGNGPTSEHVLCKTIEMEAPRPVKLAIRRESNDSIYIEWHRDPLDQNPIDDFALYQEKNSLSGATQESLSVRLAGNQSHYKAPGLKCGTRYHFYIIAQNKVGKSQASEIVSASTSGNLPVIPSKTSLIRLVNSTCLLVNLNAFQDNGCRIRTFTIRYRAEKTLNPNGSSLLIVGTNGLTASHAALVAAASSMNAAAAAAGGGGLISADSGSGGPGALVPPSLASSSSSLGGVISSPSEWITIRPRSSNAKLPQREEDRMEYLCDLDPVGEYTIHVAATNDVGRSEMQYTVQMASDELKFSLVRETLDLLTGLPNVFAYVPSLIVLIFAGLFVGLVGLIMYTTGIRYYQKFIIIHNQLRASRRAKRDEKRRRNNLRQQQQNKQQQLDCWEDQFDEEEGYGDDEDDEDDDDDSSAASGNAIHRHSSSHHHHQRQFSAANQSMNAGAGAAGHYVSNISNSAFDTSSIDSPCNGGGGGGKYGAAASGSCLSTISNDSSIHRRFQCLNSKSYVKMNEYTMLPSISANLATMSNDIYGTVGGPAAAAAASVAPISNDNNNSLYHYSTLRRSNMQTYLPHQQTTRAHQSAATLHQSPQQRQQQQQRIPQTMHQPSSQRRSQNVSDIYGYYLAPPAPSTSNSSPSQREEAANSIFVPPSQQQQQQQHPIIYSAPNIRRQPVFL